MERLSARSDGLRMRLMMLGLVIVTMQLFFCITDVGCSDTSGTGLSDLLDLVSSEQEVDLVIIFDRSHSMTAHTFYTVQISLIENLIRYELYIKLESCFSHLSFVIDGTGQHGLCLVTIS